MDTTTILAILDKTEAILLKLTAYNGPAAKQIRRALTAVLMFAEQVKAELWDGALTDETLARLESAMHKGTILLYAWTVCRIMIKVRGRQDNSFA